MCSFSEIQVHHKKLSPSMVRLYNMVLAEFASILSPSVSPLKPHTETSMSNMITEVEQIVNNIVYPHSWVT